MTKPSFRETLSEYLRAGYQCLQIQTSEEARVEAELMEVGKEHRMPFVPWGVDEGFTFEGRNKTVDDKFRNPALALREIVNPNGIFGTGNYILGFRDLDDFLAVNPELRRILRTLVESNRLSNKSIKRPIVILSPVGKIHEKLKSCITLLDFALPGETELQYTLDFVAASLKDEHKEQLTPELAEQVVAAMRGLTSNEAENALSRCAVRHGGFTPAMLSTIKEEKANIIRKSEVLTYIPEDHQASRDEIGGFDEWLDWVERRRLAYSKDARAHNIDYPKGAVLIGVPGTGKSYVAAATAKLLGLPGYIMDVGSIFGSLVGESEQRMRDALNQVEAQQGCVLLLDEADKAFGGATESSGDSGVTRRVFGKLLTWLAQKQDRTFVIMTLNRTRGIDPEFLRAGRFDSVFWTDLPSDYERRVIFDIHFRKRQVEPEQLGFTPAQWDTLVKETNGFVGAEIEQVVKESRYISWERRRTGIPNFDEVMEASQTITPLSQLEKEKVEEIREWCKSRATSVSRPRAVPKTRRSRNIEPNATN